MFFIMGTDAKVRQLGSVGAACPRCGRSAAFSLCKCYSFIHLFFIPIFRYHVRYIATCPGCASVYEVAPEAGRAVEKGQKNSLLPSELTLVRDGGAGVCPGCGAQVPPGSAYCNRCGTRL